MVNPALTSSAGFWLNFSRLRLSVPKMRRLLTYFGDVESAWSASREQLEVSRLLDEKQIAALVQQRKANNLAAYLERMHQYGIQAFTLDHADYPVLLRQIPDPPYVLYVRGSLHESDGRAIAIAGTRDATPYGRDVTRSLVQAFAQAEVSIIGGLSAGIENFAHRAALNDGTRTIAALPCGLDQVYPKEHAELAAQIIKRGALISEHALGVGAERFHFVPRNRLISGLSLGVVIVEASENSGSLTIAECAAEQGRQVFAVPGAITVPHSVGTNRLIQDGAALVVSARDVLESLRLIDVQADQPKPVSMRTGDPSKASPVKASDGTKPKDRASAVMSDAVISQSPFHWTADVLSSLAQNETEMKILTALDDSTPLALDDLGLRSELSTRDLLNALTLLQLRDLVREVNMQEYVRVAP